MKTVEDYERIRKAYYVDGLSIRAISKKYGHGRELVRKALEHPEPPGYQLKHERPAPVLALYKSRIDELIAESEKQPRKQRYTAHKIYEMICAEGYKGSEGGVHRYVSEQRAARKKRQAYLPLAFDPGQDAQVDWGEVVAVIGGERQKVQIFVMRLNHSKARFVTPALALRESAAQVWRFPSKNRKPSLKGTSRLFISSAAFRAGLLMTT